MTVSPSRIVVLGAGGLVGSWISRLAHSDGRVVVDVYRRDIDLRSADAVSRVAAITTNSDVIVVAAANASVEACEADPDGTAAINVGFPLALAKERPGARLVAFSSEYVFGDALDRAANERDAPGPLNVYGQQKCALEAGLLHQGPTSAHLVCRTSAVYDVDGAEKNFVSQLLRAARLGLSLPVANDQVVTPTLARELARFVLLAIDCGLTGIWHTAGPQVLHRDQFAALVAHTFDVPTTAWTAVPTRSLGLRAPRPSRAALDTTRVAVQCPGLFSKPAVGLATMSADLRSKRDAT